MGNGPDEGKGSPQAGDNKGQGQPQGDGQDSKLEKFFGRLDVMVEKFDALDKKVNLIQSSMLSPEYLDQGGKPKPKPEKPADEPKPRDFNSVDWENLSTTEVVREIVTELNRVLGGAKGEVDGRFKALNDTIEELQTDLDINNAIMQIARTEKCSVGDAADKFFNLADDLEDLGKKFPNITALDAYKIATGQLKKPAKKEGEDAGKPDDDRKRFVKEVAEELKGGGGKPGGATDLGTKTPKSAHEVVSKRYDEIFSSKG